MEKTKLPIPRNGSKGDSNPGTLDCKSGILPLSDRASYNLLQTNLLAIKCVQTVQKIITTRLDEKLDENQPREQAVFRSKYSTPDHKNAINQREVPLCVAFVDFVTAFDSVQTHATWTSLQEQGIEDVYIEILKVIYIYIYGQLSVSTAAQRE